MIQVNWVQGFWWDTLPFSNQILISRKFVGDYHVRSASPAALYLILQLFIDVLLLLVE